MRIKNLNAPHETQAAPAAAIDTIVAGAAMSASPAGADAVSLIERQALEIAFLKARIQHLDLVLETARSLMGSNHERLLRRLHELPREIVELSAQLRRLDPASVW